MKPWISIMLSFFLLVVSGCSNAVPSTPSSVPTSSDSTPETSSSLGKIAQPSTCEIYKQAFSGNLVMAEWLNNTNLLWVTENQNTDSKVYNFTLFDVLKEEAVMIFTKEIDADLRLDMTASLTDGVLNIYYSDNSPAHLYNKIALHAQSLEVVGEESIAYDYLLYWAEKSRQDMVLRQKSTIAGKPSYGLHPFAQPQMLTLIARTQETRYSFSGITWSPSGEYFMLKNEDAFGMDRFESPAELFAYPKSEWPTAVQYDVFNKDGGFVFSFAVDTLYRDDGSETSYDMYWMPDNQIYIASTFYDAVLNTRKTTEQVVSDTGEITFTKTSDGERRYYNADSFICSGALELNQSDDGTHLVRTSFLTGKTIDYGIVDTKEAWDWLGLYPNADGTTALMSNGNDNILYVLKLEE